MIKFISFDLDGTVTHNIYPDLVWLEGLPKIYAKEKKISLNDAKKILMEEYDKIGDNKVEWYDIEYWFNRFNLKYKWKKLLDDYKNKINLYPEVEQVIINLSKKVDLIISSNAKKEFIDIQLKKTKLKKYFSYVFSSTSDFHRVKKVTEFYKMVCDYLKIEPYEIIHVGDHIVFDYKIPLKIGIKSFLIDRKKIQKGDYIVYDLKEFERKIKTFL